MSAKNVHILLIGDQTVGKTSIIERYIKREFLSANSNTVINEYTKNVPGYQLNIRDTSGLKEYKALRYLQYCEIDIILCCFNLSNWRTLDSLELVWFDEIKEFCPQALRILVGCQSDLECKINEQSIMKIQKLLKINKYVMCSAKRGENIDQVFNTAINAYQCRNKFEVKKTKRLNKLFER